MGIEKNKPIQSLEAYKDFLQGHSPESGELTLEQDCRRRFIREYIIPRLEHYSLLVEDLCWVPNFVNRCSDFLDEPEKNRILGLVSNYRLNPSDS